MGNECSCIEQAYKHLGSNDEAKAAKDRTELLQRGGKFARKAMLGLTSQELFMKLSDDTSAVEWKTVGKPAWTGAEEHGCIDLTNKIKNVKISGTQGLVFVGKDKDMPIFEANALDAATRDQWVISINELLHNWESRPESKPRYDDSASKSSDKIKYFKKREEELQERIKAGEEKKKKYATGGMQHVAAAMMNRS
mmetsp:Transcript_35262/g.33491  ORF Transcript_35262/g.33491 Transcript_35262/m.33491 type:complete len:195 (+) Transcript_35262:182-766(+)|eukprot:CAMPEP_0119045882 /NCGR_PEP_ID=MMETSP1177-20130426/43113_1 /TAXON_ID=2985 /ORGANISM="Ochromonas sp, Strain CCMP1899" /LENGTH=194 /DNA_ID=CAMNT_0007018319 /DNA_START=100 /DNA_END=684 /DNA_ORIENTATION=+